MATIINYPFPESGANAGAPQLPPHDASYWSDDQIGAPYTYYDVVMSYRGSMGRYMQPVAGLPTTTQAGYGQANGGSPGMSTAFGAARASANFDRNRARALDVSSVSSVPLPPSISARASDTPAKIDSRTLRRR